MIEKLLKEAALDFIGEFEIAPLRQRELNLILNKTIDRMVFMEYTKGREYLLKKDEELRRKADLFGLFDNRLVFLDNKGYPIERIIGHPIRSFFRIIFNLNGVMRYGKYKMITGQKINFN